jgi:hypothetical protein
LGEANRKASKFLNQSLVVYSPDLIDHDVTFFFHSGDTLGELNSEYFTFWLDVGGDGTD